MSDNELRDRIAEYIWQNTMVTTEGSRRIAQEIIDDLGLTVERTVDAGNRSYDKRTGIVTNGWKYRVVGKWEKQ